MPWKHLSANFLGGLFLANAIPHLVNGISGRPFQTPLAKPPGVGLSSSRVNVVWAFASLLIGWTLLELPGSFDIAYFPDVVAALLGAFLISFLLARHFGKFHGGNHPQL
jgi:hypothetical protein